MCPNPDRVRCGNRKERTGPFFPSRQMSGLSDGATTILTEGRKSDVQGNTAWTRMFTDTRFQQHRYPGTQTLNNTDSQTYTLGMQTFSVTSVHEEKIFMTEKFSGRKKNIYLTGNVI